MIDEKKLAEFKRDRTPDSICEDEVIEWMETLSAALTGLQEAKNFHDYYRNHGIIECGCSYEIATGHKLCPLKEALAPFDVPSEEK